MSSAENDPTSHFSVNNHAYIVSASTLKRPKRGSLIDRGANGGILGTDGRVIFTHQCQVDVTGIDHHEITDLKIVDAVARVETDKGPAILRLNQYAYQGTDQTIHSSGQIEFYKNIVDDRSMKVGGKQCIQTFDGYIIPIDIINGLAYLKMFPPTDKELEQLPTIIMTAPDEWDPTVLDLTLTDKDDWANTLKEFDQGLIPTPFDKFGNYRH